MKGEAERRAGYERLYAEVREARRSLHEAAAAGADAVQLLRLKKRLELLRARLAAWQRGKP